MMNKGLAALGLSAIAWGMMLAPVSARIIRYEINGKYYTYDSTRPEQIAVARKVIEAANAADQAQAIANAERESNPLTTIFGSKAQQAAAQAKAHLERVLAAESQAINAAARPASRSAEPSRAAAPTRPARSEEKVEPRRSAAVEAPRVEPENDAPVPTPSDSESPELRSVFLDPETGIRTTFMADGTVREELAEAAARTDDMKEGDHLARQQQDESTADTTGSTTRRKADPAR
jgi:hypothetical protein